MQTSAGKLSAQRRRGSCDSSASVVISGPAARTAAAVTASEPEVIESMSKFELYDAAAVVVLCPSHQKFGFRRIGPKKSLWFVTAVVSKIDGFEASIRSKLKQLLAHPDSETGFIPFAPLTEMQYTRIQCPVVGQFVTRVLFHTRLTHDLLCCNEACSLDWKTVDQIAELIGSEFWGPEPLSLVPGMRTTLHPLIVQPFTELTVAAWSGLRPEAVTEVLTAGYQVADVNRIYGDFVQHAFPSSFLTYNSLIQYLVRSGMIETENKMPQRIAKVFFSNSTTGVVDNNSVVDFSRFVAGLAVLDSDSRQNGLKGNRSFIACAANKDRMAYPVIDSRFSDVTTLSRSQDAKCPKCVGPDHMVTNFSVSLMPDAQVAEFVEQSLADNVPMPIFEKELQYNLTNGRWFANQMIQWIYDHAFVTHAYSGPMELPNVRRRREPKPLSLWDLDRPELLHMICQLCDLVKVLLIREKRVVELRAPCFVVGSMDGSLNHLLDLDRLFWPKSMPFSVGRYVFLGNFSGSSGCGLEVLLYLFAAKCSAPQKVVLLRGKNENRNQMAHLSQELSQRFPAEAASLADRICSVFEVMPISCFVNGWELCSSGGLCSSIPSVEALDQIPVHVPDTDSDSLTKEMVDPTTGESVTQLVAKMRSLRLNSLILGTKGPSVATYLTPGAVYQLSSTERTSVLLMTEEKMRKIEMEA